MRNLILTLLLILTKPLLLRADYTFLGFSTDGHYCAFAQNNFHVSEDVFYQSVVRVVEVDKNDYVGTPLVIIVTQQEAQSRSVEGSSTEYDMAPLIAGEKKPIQFQALMRSYDIATWKEYTPIFRGDFYISDHLEDMQPYLLHNAEFTLINGKQSEVISVDLTERPAPDTIDNEKIFTLTWSEGGQSHILQEDKRLYQSRLSPRAYTIREVYLYRDKIAVLIDSVIPAMQGPNDYMARTLIVTGSLQDRP